MLLYIQVLATKIVNSTDFSTFYLHLQRLLCLSHYFVMDSLLLYKSLFFATLAIAVLAIALVCLVLYAKSKGIKKSNCIQKKSKDLNEKLLLVIKAAKMSTWDINVMERTIDFNFENFTPLQDKGHYTTTIDRYYAALHPDDLKKIQQSYIEILNGKKEYFQEKYRVVFPGQKDFTWIESFAVIEKRDDAGIPVSLVGASILTNVRSEASPQV